MVTSLNVTPEIANQPIESGDREDWSAESCWRRKEFRRGEFSRRSVNKPLRIRQQNEVSGERSLGSDRDAYLRVISFFFLS